MWASVTDWSALRDIFIVSNHLGATVTACAPFWGTASARAEPWTAVSWIYACVTIWEPLDACIRSDRLPELRNILAAYQKRLVTRFSLPYAVVGPHLMKCFLLNH